MEKVPSLQVIWEKQVHVVVKNPPVPTGMAGTKTRKIISVGKDLLGEAPCFDSLLNILLLYLFYPLKVLSSRCLPQEQVFNLPL